MMELIKNCKIHCLSEALSPITHMMGASGNEAIINREQIMYKNEIRSVPVLSGNAIRHKMVRDPGGLFLINECGLAGKLNIDQANYLLNGGSLTESSTTENIGRIAEMQTLLPLNRLLGGSLRNQVVGGSLFVLRGILVCEETRNQISKMLPDGYDLPETPLRSAEDFIGGYQYTRGDARRRNDASLLLEGNDGDGKTNLMIYNGQSVIPGSIFYHGFILQNVSPIEVGALLHSLQQWESSGAFIGGQSRIGHGKLKLSVFFKDGEYSMGNELNPAEVVKMYIDHVHANAEKISEWMNNAFPAKVKSARSTASEVLDL
jgi:hypothetical protein